MQLKQFSFNKSLPFNVGVSGAVIVTFMFFLYGSNKRREEIHMEEKYCVALVISRVA